METPEQKKDRERLSRYIKREQLASLMNDTKWQELCDEILLLPYKPHWKVQCLRDPPASDHWASDWHYHMPPYKCIEWLDVNPIAFISRRGALVPDEVQDLSEELKRIMKKIGVPFSVNGKFYRVWGYLRPGQHVEFA